MGIPFDDVVTLRHPTKLGDPSEITVNCPDKLGLGCDLFRILLFFGMKITRVDMSTDGKWCLIVVWVMPNPETRWNLMMKRLIEACPTCSSASGISYYRAEFLRPPKTPDVFLLQFCCKDRGGLLHDVTSVLSELELNIKRVKVSTTPDGRVMDLFFITDTRELLHTKKRQEDTFEHLRATIGEDLLCCDIEKFVPEVTACSTAPSFLPPEITGQGSSGFGDNTTHRHVTMRDPSITIDNSLSPSHTLVQILCEDHVGLLYDIMRTFKDYNIQDVGKAFNEWKQGEPAIERLFELTRFKPRVTEIPDAIDLTSITGEVKFSGISFRYGDGLPLILNEVNLHIKSGETVAFVGPSGGGKTTLVKLLLRLYDPLCGSIYIDGHNIQSLQLGSLRRHVGLVSQDITLFSGTVSENIGYKDLMNGIDMERVRLAAKTANADEFVRSLPEAYETEIGPRGVTLSGGQKQRLAIARALYQNSSILIMDEATSALDSMSELLVRQALERLTEDHTVLVIAHRIETVLMADRIFLLENGRLEEIPRSSLINGRQNSLASAGLVI